MGLSKSQKRFTKDIRLRAVVTKFFSDIPMGTVGFIVKSWTNYQCTWYKLYLGTNRGGRRMYKSFPADILKIDHLKAFQFIKADQFFPKYCPQIKSYKHKIRGKNGRGNPVEFSEEELKAIRAALKRLVKDLLA